MGALHRFTQGLVLLALQLTSGHSATTSLPVMTTPTPDCVIPDDLAERLTSLQQAVNASQPPIFFLAQTDLNHPTILSNNTGDVCNRSYVPPTRAPQNVRSDCPWDVVETLDADRFPATLTNVTCLCTHCRNVSSNLCSSVSRQVPVLRRTGHCEDGIWQYKLSYETQTTGCTCASPTQ